jgi:hypothetical protein
MPNFFASRRIFVNLDEKFGQELATLLIRCLLSVAKGPKFRPHNSKGALQKFVRPKKLAAELSFKMLKKGRKGAELF